MSKDFLSYIKEEVEERIENFVGREMYAGDIGFNLSETENANGSWYCSTYKAIQELKEYLEDFFDFQEWYRCNFGEPIMFESDADDYRNSPECVHCSMMIFAIENVFNSAFAKTKYSDEWNEKITITEEFCEEIKKALEEVESVW